MKLPFQLTANRIRTALLSVALLSTTVPAYAIHEPTHMDARDLAALFLFNGQSGQRAYDLKGPVGGEEALWNRPSVGRFEFATIGFGVILQGTKTVNVTRTCRIIVRTQLAWLYQDKPAQTLERAEEYDFSKTVVSDAILAMRGDAPQATILIMQGSERFYCRETRINGGVVEPSHCARAAEIVAGPGLRSDVIRSGFRRFSNECKSQL